MILISYDIKDDKLRTKFAKFITKFGHRMQYSVFEITHSSNMLGKIKDQINEIFGHLFCENDSVIIIETSKTCEITYFGREKHNDEDVIISV